MTSTEIQQHYGRSREASIAHFDAVTALELPRLTTNPVAPRYAVRLSNCGNPDRRQDATRPLPDTACGWAQADDLQEVVALVESYIEYYQLGGGNWNGGKITHKGATFGRVSYNGRVWDNSGKEIEL